MSKVGRKKILSSDEIIEAHFLREQGWTKRQLALKYEVGETTIWENIFLTGNIRRTFHKGKETFSFKKLPPVVALVTKMRDEDGMTSLEISGILEISLNEVNFIFSHNPTINSSI